jgi:hypothetical protein
MALSGDYIDLPGGHVRLDMSDGSHILLSGRDADAEMLSQTNPQGDVFSDFDHANPPNPHHVIFHDGGSADYDYPGDGTVQIHMSDGTQIVMSGTGEDAVTLTQTTPEGDVFSNFDSAGHPHHVVFHG